MSRNNKRDAMATEEERANRKTPYPNNLSRRDKFWYNTVALLGTVQALILRHAVDEHIWRSTDGRVRRLKDLGEGHLDNILQLLQRKGIDVDPIQYEQVVLELRRRVVERRAAWLARVPVEGIKA